MLFLREVLVSDLFNYRKGSVERGQVWDNIADRLNALEFPKFQVNQCYLRDKLNKLLKWFKKKDQEELSLSGIDPELDEKSELLEEIVEKMESTVPINLSKKGKIIKISTLVKKFEIWPWKPWEIHRRERVKILEKKLQRKKEVGMRLWNF